MENMQRIVFYFDRGAFLGGSLSISIELIPEDEEQVKFTMTPSNNLAHMKSQCFKMPKNELQKIELFLKELSYWKIEYIDEETASVTDGYGWEIRFNYSGFKFLSGGYVCYPEDYKEKINALQNIMEYFCEKYDGENYEAEYREARMEV